MAIMVHHRCIAVYVWRPATRQGFAASNVAIFRCSPDRADRLSPSLS
jgi:hypothetical protein